MLYSFRQRDAEGYRAHLQITYMVSERRACSALGADRTSIHYRGHRADDEAVRMRVCELTSVRRRFGYRRLHILLRRKGIVMYQEAPAPLP
jgi:putative transposase